MTQQGLTIGGRTLRSRLIVGTGKYESYSLMREAIEASGADLVTVAIRRVDLAGTGAGAGILDNLPEAVTLLPNTAGCFTADEAVRAAHLAREACQTSLVKVEVIGDEKTLFPDSEGLLEATRRLVADGFTVMPYMSDDPVLARRLQDEGAACVMPLGAPIGSGLGVRNPYNLRILIEAVSVPVIIDAGVGTASDAAVAMELGCDGVLMNTGIAGARDPVKMARAMKAAVEAGRMAFEAGRIPKKLYATASSPMQDLIGG